MAHNTQKYVLVRSVENTIPNGISPSEVIDLYDPADLLKTTVDGALDVKPVAIKQEIVLAGVSRVDITIPMQSNSADIIEGRIYMINDASPFAMNSILTMYKRNTFKSKDALYRAESQIVRTHLNANVSVLDTLLNVDDASDFNKNDFLKIHGANEEFLVTKSQGGGGVTINIDDSADLVHTSGDAVSRIFDFGGFRVLDLDESKNLYLSVEFASAVTDTLCLDLLIRK